MDYPKWYYVMVGIIFCIVISAGFYLLLWVCVEDGVKMWISFVIGVGIGLFFSKRRI